MSGIRNLSEGGLCFRRAATAAADGGRQAASNPVLGSAVYLAMRAQSKLSLKENLLSMQRNLIHIWSFIRIVLYCSPMRAKNLNKNFTDNEYAIKACFKSTNQIIRNFLKWNCVKTGGISTVGTFDVELKPSKRSPLPLPPEEKMLLWKKGKKKKVLLLKKLQSRACVVDSGFWYRAKSCWQPC